VVELLIVIGEAALVEPRRSRSQFPSMPSNAQFDWMAEGRRVLAAQPFSRLLGAEMISLTADAAELRLRLHSDLNQHRGQVHGGVVGYLADNTIAFAAAPHLGGDIVTSDYSLNFCRPALGPLLRARAQVLSTGRTKAVVKCDVYSVDGEEETLCAVAIGTVVTTTRSGSPN